MSTTFVMKGSTAKTVHGAYAHGPLVIKGHFTMSGPQPIDNTDGCPQWVADLLDQHPDLQRIALSGDKWGVVFTRMDTADGKSIEGRDSPTFETENEHG